MAVSLSKAMKNSTFQVFGDRELQKLFECGKLVLTMSVFRRHLVKWGTVKAANFAERIIREEVSLHACKKYTRTENLSYSLSSLLFENLMRQL